MTFQSPNRFLYSLLQSSSNVSDSSSADAHCTAISPLLELALVLVRLDHVARFIVNANHGVM
jgi:hypothetical protein